MYLKELLEKAKKDKELSKAIEDAKSDVGKMLHSTIKTLLNDNAIDFIAGGFMDLEKSLDELNPHDLGWMIRQEFMNVPEFDRIFREDELLRLQYNTRVKDEGLSRTKATNKFNKHRQINDQVLRLIFARAADLLKDSQPSISELYDKISESITAESVIMAKEPEAEVKTRTKRANAVLDISTKKRDPDTPPRKPLPKAPSDEKKSAWKKAQPTQSAVRSQKSGRFLGQSENKTQEQQSPDSPVASNRSSRRSDRS